jgi:hypothetical protein
MYHVLIANNYPRDRYVKLRGTVQLSFLRGQANQGRVMNARRLVLVVR